MKKVFLTRKDPENASLLCIMFTNRAFWDITSAVNNNNNKKGEPNVERCIGNV